MNKKRTNNGTRSLHHCRYGVWQRNKSLDWAKPIHRFQCVVALIFLAGIILLSLLGDYVVYIVPVFLIGLFGYCLSGWLIKHLRDFLSSATHNRWIVLSTAAITTWIGGLWLICSLVDLLRGP